MLYGTNKEFLESHLKKKKKKKKKKMNERNVVHFYCMSITAI